MINLKAAAQSVSSKGQREGKKKEPMISFHHSVFLYTGGLELSFPRPPQGQRTEAGV